jgi:transposase
MTLHSVEACSTEHDPPQIGRSLNDEPVRRHRKKGGGRVEAGKNSAKRKTRPVSRAPGGRAAGAAKTVHDGRRNEQIQAEWRSGREPRALAAEFGLSLSRTYEIIKECREGGIEELELTQPWRAQRFADELLIQKKRAINDARELELRAREQGNTAVELGAYKARVQATRDYAMFLQETGRLNGLRDLKFEAEVGEFWDAVSEAFTECGVSDDVWVVIGRALGVAVNLDDKEGSEPPPRHWRPNGEEQTAIARQHVETTLRSVAEEQLLGEAKQRRIEENDREIAADLEAKKAERERREEARRLAYLDDLARATRREGVKRSVGEWRESQLEGPAAED